MNDCNNLLYIIEQKDNKINQNNIKYSTKKEYKNIINKYSNDRILLTKYILSLEERQWYSELINISDILIKKREKEQIFFSNKFIRKTIKLYEQFKWLIESLGVFFSYKIFGSENPNFNFDESKFGLPEKNQMKWFHGFKWKGIYIRVMPIEKSKILLNEIKALNYFYFEYLQLLEEFEYINENHLLYQLIFPIIAYTEINGFILFGSALINYQAEESNNQDNKNDYNHNFPFINLENIINHNNEVINFYYNLSDSINYNGLLKRENKDIKKKIII